MANKYYLQNQPFVTVRGIYNCKTELNDSLLFSEEE